MTRDSNWDESSLAAPHTDLARTTRDFVMGLRAVWVIFTRYPESDKWLLHRSTDEFLESAVAIYVLGRDGVLGAGRRELRYMLEAAVKYVYVDQQVPGEAILADRLSMVQDPQRVPRSSVTPIDGVVLRMQRDGKALRDAVKSLFGDLSGYVHVSGRQLQERFRRTERGEFIGFESSRTAARHVQAVKKVYDVVLALIFEGVGPMFTGELFLQVFDDHPEWVFHTTPFVREVSRHFDYKADRKPPHERGYGRHSRRD